MKPEHWIAIAGILTALLGTWLGAALAHRYRRVQDAEKAREALETQADLFASAVLAARIAGHNNDRYWNGWGSVAKIAVLAGVQLVPGLARSNVSLFAALGSRTDRVAAMIAYMDAPRTQAAIEVTIAMKEAVSAAMPLARHSDAVVAHSTDALLEALMGNAEETAIREALTSFRGAVRTAATPPVPRWRVWNRGRVSGAS